MNRNTKLTIVAIVVTGFFAFWISHVNFVVQSQPWQKAEGVLIDLRYKSKELRPPDPNIVLVGIETSSQTLSALSPEEIAASPTLQKMKMPWPWDRTVYAATLEKLLQAGAKVVVFDFIFSNPGSKEGDEAFAAVIQKHHEHVVLASAFDEESYKGAFRYNYLPPFSELTGDFESDIVGLATTKPELDTVIRRGRYLTSQAREANLSLQEPDNLMQLSAMAVRKFSGKVELPPYDRDNFIAFEDRYVPIPIESLFVDRLWANPPIDGGSAFRDRIVIVGPIANFFHDVHTTPLGERPGPEIQAHMTATLLNHTTYEEPSAAYSRAITLVMILMAGTICIFASNAATKSALLAGTLAGFYGVCLVAFLKPRIMVTMVPPLFSFVSTGVVGVGFQFLLEQRERRRYRNVLDRYVSKNVADLVLEDQRSFEESLRGQKRQIAILFSDVRGFTTMTEERDPEELVQQLNEYFKEMVDIIQIEESGTLSKFIGDAIMAAWGDTVVRTPEEDARRAVRAALKMRAGLATLNANWAKRPGRVPFQTGIGVNFGEALVGNIGTETRAELAVLGDVINLAARLETATKQFHVDILVGESVELLTRTEFVYRRVGLLTVKGKGRAVDTFTVLSDRKAGEPPWLARYHQAIEQFRRREFQQAAETFNSVSSELGGEDYLCAMYIEWCARYQNSPPPEIWNGGFVLTEK